MQQASTNPRKRPAPGAYSTAQSAAQGPNNPAAINVPDPSQMTDEQFLNWSSNRPLANDQGLSFEPGIWDGGAQTMQMPGGINQQNQISNQLVRRNIDNQLAAQSRQADTYAMDNWWPDSTGGDVTEWKEPESDTELTQMAQIAKAEALSQRPQKSIPPFIKKLSTFLDNDQENRHLIRWSDDGKSVQVLDEDEFANTLLPELFKHRNYASFVRQLNMYGFHKKVGLADNSMRASEKKTKNVSEYYNRYFQRGRPDLWWLINKPKTEPGNSKKRKKGGRNGDQGSDDGDEPRQDREAADDKGGGGPTRKNSDMVTLPKTEFASLQREVMQLQRSHQQITSMISRLRDENNKWNQQAAAMVAQHERQENSINAIRKFLTTFFHESLEGNGSARNMFANAIPHSQNQGNVFDMGDFNGSPITPTSGVPRQARRPLLLPAPEAQQVQEINETPISATDTQYLHPNRPFSNQQHSPRVTSAPSSARSSPARDTPNQPSQPQHQTYNQRQARQQQHQPVQPCAPNQEDIMSVINNANANATSRTTSHSSAAADPLQDLGNALQKYQTANGRDPLTREQRDSVLSIMASNSGAPLFPTTTNQSGSSNGTASTNNLLLGNYFNDAGQQNQLQQQFQPPPPQQQQNNPYLDHFSDNEKHLDMLQKLQEEQNSNLQDLADRLQPLSPSGAIPGLALQHGDGTNRAANGLGTQDVSDFDLNSYLNDDYFGGDAGAAGLNFDDATKGDDLFGETGFGDGADDAGAALDAWNTAGGGGGAWGGYDGNVDGGGRIVGSVDSGSSSGAPSPMVKNEEMDAGQGMGKRRRVG